ncbi:MAG: hypothetical protein GXO82_04355, partial [Chlorobi bacterium]|nr:hypothetical protein [Chlorobiota bacterium]
MKRVTISPLPFSALLFFAVALFPHDSAVSQDVRYPFTFPWNDSLLSGDAMRFFPRMSPEPAGRHGFLKAGSRFSFSDGTPARFTGINFSFGASMADSAIIDQVAPRLAKFGVNVVRMHHMDNYNTWNERETLLDLPFPGAGTRNLNLSQVKRLAYTIYRLGEHGIYSNINLHVSRRFQAADGVVNADSLLKYGKGVSIFDPVIRRLMKEYAANLLGYVNPYTGLRLADDPRVAFVEITNENSLVRYWAYGYLNYTEGSERSISLYHSRYLDSLWTRWLQARYTGTAALNDAWSERSTGPIVNMLINGSFESEFTGKWEIEQHQGARVRATREPGGIDGAYCARIDIDTVTGTSWHVQVKQAGTAKILRDSLYTVTFSARASSPRSVPVRVMNNEANWEFYGLGISANLETEWKTFQFSFRSLATDTSHTRLAFNLGADTGTVWLDAVSFTVLDHDGLLPDESLEKGTVRRVGGNEASKVTRKRLRDTEAFFIALQKDFFDDMYRFLKDSVGVKCPVAGTNSLGGLGDLFTQTGMDYIDNHAYWQHPRFPNRPWDAWDWYIPNTPMTADTSYGTMPRLSSYAVKGKPYVVSEYNHPAPNWYQCEMPLLFGAVASYQDWGAIYIYSYHHGHDDWDHEHINRYFDIDGNPTVLALLPQMSAMFRHGWIRPALRTVDLEFAPGDILAEALLPYGPIFFSGLPADTPLRFGLRVGSFQASETPDPDSYGVPPSTGTPASDTGELLWKASGEGSRF